MRRGGRQVTVQGNNPQKGLETSANVQVGLLPWTLEAALPDVVGLVPLNIMRHTHSRPQPDSEWMQPVQLLPVPALWGQGSLKLRMG